MEMIIFGAPIMIWILMVFAIGLLCLTQHCFSVMRACDSSLYERLGRPDTFSNNNVAVMWGFWRWVVWNSVGEKVLVPRVRFIVNALRIGVVLYVAGILFFIMLNL